MNNSSTTPWIDLLFNMLLMFVFFFYISYMMIKPKIKEPELNTKAEFMITVLWQDNCNDDVDSWVRDPLGNIAWFREKQVGMLHLDRDDLGNTNDTVTLPDGTVISCKYNQELTSIRGYIPGEWTVNVHMYKKRDSSPTTVKVFIDKLNPFSRIVQKEIILNTVWQEETVTRFEMSSTGNIITINNIPAELVIQKLTEEEGQHIPSHLTRSPEAMVH